MIKIQKQFSEVARKGIISMYENMVAHDDVDQMGYLNNKIFQKIAILQGSEIEMERYIAAYATIMFELLTQETREQPPALHHRYMMSALYYLCDPFDYFPDMQHEDAHADDALVINHCLEKIAAESGETMKRIRNFINDSNI